MRTIVLSAVVLVCLTASVHAGSQIDVRLVTILPGSSSDSSGVDDIIGVLKKNIGENRYSVAGQDTIGLPASGQTSDLGNVLLTCSGDQKNLQITVSTKGKVIVNTNVELESGKPFILGGTQGKTKFVLVFVAK